MPRRGESLIELLVALVLLEIIGAASLATALTIERSDRHAAAGAADDLARWQQYRAVELLPACATRAFPDTSALQWPATSDRPALSATVRCGP